MSSEVLDKIFADLLALEDRSKQKLPPVHLWGPALSGQMDLVIDREGRWIHEGGEIKRPALVKLFSSILKKENGDYYLVTPVEKWRITVDVAPFFITTVKKNIRGDQQAISCITSVGDNIVVGKTHPFWVEYVSGSDEPIPLVKIREGLDGLLSRSAFYQLVDWADSSATQIGNELSFLSMGEKFRLGLVS